MKKTLYLILAFSIISTTGFSQKKIKFGKVSKKELEEKFHPLDSTADAAYLLKKRRTYFNFIQSSSTFEVFTEVHQRIKIYTKEGFKKATQAIRFYSPERRGSQEKVKSIKAFTFTLVDGKIVKQKLEKDNIFTEQVNKYWGLKKFTLPNIKEGCVIDFKYKIISPSWRISDLKFQTDIPIKKLSCSVEIPEFFKFNKRFKGYYSITPETKNTQYNSNQLEYGTTTTIYKANDVPALKDDEPYVDNIRNYRGTMKYELSSIVIPRSPVRNFSNTWKDVSKQIYQSESFGGELEKRKYFIDDLTALGLEGKSEQEKIATIFEFVKSKVKWNGFYGWSSDSGVKKAYSEGTGNVADINLMLVAVLKEAGLIAYPTILSSRNNGVPLFPTIDGFNYVIAAVKDVEGNYYLLDASEKYSTPNTLPKRTINWSGRMITESGNSSTIDLTPTNHSKEKNTMNLTLDENLHISGMLRSSHYNLNGLNYRNTYNHLSEESHISKLEDLYKIEIGDFKVSNQDNYYKPISHSIQFESDDLVETIGDKVYISPLAFLKKSINPFKLEDRKFPIDFVSPWKEINKVQIKIPDGYQIESVPESKGVAMSKNLGVFKYMVKKYGNSIAITSIVEFNERIISPKYYQELKRLFNDIIEKQAEKIVLVKK